MASNKVNRLIFLDVLTFQRRLENQRQFDIIKCFSFILSMITIILAVNFVAITQYPRISWNSLCNKGCIIMCIATRFSSTYARVYLQATDKYLAKYVKST